jgi:membrane protease YdiL (CAAX protease family)
MTPRRVLWGTVGLLVAFTLLRAGHVFGDLSDAVLVVLSLVVTLVALRGGMARSQLGLSRDDVGRGLLAGLAVFGLVLVVVVVGAFIPATSAFMDDDRVRVGVGGLARELFLSILIGTVIPEELLFRGVILGSGLQQWRPRRAMLVSSLLFACWHIAPTLATAGGNAELSGVVATVSGRLGLVAGAMVSTFVAGVVFAWLRVRSASLVAPVIAHLSTNGVAFTVAWFVAR